MADKKKTNIPAEWLLAGGTIFALATGLLFSEFGRFRQGELLTKEVAAARADADAALKAVIAPDALQDAEKSVYLVYDRNGWGSAFVIDRERGLLGTAAHVAEATDLEDRKNEAFAVNRFSKKPLRIYAKRMHAGYGDLSRVAEEYQPLDPKSSVFNPRVVPVFDLANDAAVLFVDPIDPDTGENILGPSLPVAERAALLALKPGEPIANISYPADTIDSYLARESAAARSDRGTIANLISPIDLAVDSDDASALSLIIHRMSIAPGSSGSPLFNRDMEVIGITSHGVPKGDAVAQRAEVLRDLMLPLAEEEALAKLYEPEWRSRLERFVPARDGVPNALYRAALRKKNTEDPNKPEEQIGGSDLAGELPYEKKIFELTFPEPQDNFIVAADDLKAPAEAAAPMAQQPTQGRPKISARAKTVFTINGPGRYLEGVIPLAPDLEHIVFAFDFNIGRSLFNPGVCPITMYTRFPGETALTPSLGLPVSQVRIPKTDKERKLEVLFKRPVYERGELFSECNRGDEKFIAGVVSWKPEEKPAPSAAPPAAASPAPTAALEQGYAISTVNLAAVRGDRFAKVRNFADCNLAFGDKDACIAPVKAEHVAGKASK